MGASICATNGYYALASPAHLCHYAHVRCTTRLEDCVRRPTLLSSAHAAVSAAAALSMLFAGACAAPGGAGKTRSESAGQPPKIVIPIPEAAAVAAPSLPASAPQPPAAIEPAPSETSPGPVVPTAWQPPDVPRVPFADRVERWRGLVREVLAEEWAAGTPDGPAARIDDDLVLAVMDQESRGNPRAQSWAGAMGLMQVMDFTFALMMAGSESYARQIDPAAFWDERSNVRAGIRYLALAMQYHDGDIYWSLASYNAGIGNARNWRRAGLYAVPPVGGFAETANYAPTIMRNYMRRRPDVNLYVPDVMPEEHIPGALQLLRDSRRRSA